ncbi:hypothetical protein STV34_07530 [Streptococcus agalactiae]|nr:hypothetical protein [Streptococcus dysgalactiae]MSU86550.1 hypothetical protein [Streptococcus dysgalactiae subsp. dysgalactiae]QGG98048.1 hypothetical protein EA459_05270 [Streptococcus dysgalactiae subsp. dysgalactiae]
MDLIVIIGTVAAVLTLILTCLMYYDGKKKDRAVLGIYDAFWEKDELNPFFIWFNVFNESNYPVKITKIELLDKNENPIKIVENHEFKREVKTYKQNNFVGPFGIDLNPNLPDLDILSYDPFQNENRLIKPEIIPANSGVQYKYYVRNFSENMKIRITSDRTLSGVNKKFRVYDFDITKSE